MPVMYTHFTSGPLTAQLPLTNIHVAICRHLSTGMMPSNRLLLHSSIWFSIRQQLVKLDLVHCMSCWKLSFFNLLA